MSEHGSEDELQNRLRSLPGVDAVLDALGDIAPHTVAAAAARAAVDTARERIRNGAEPPGLNAIVEHARGLVAERGRSLLQPVVNATGVIIHTNLGRVPMGERQLHAVLEVAGSYSNLEYDLAHGRRGSRYSHATGMICTLTGAESSLVVNNNAAAILVTLAALCRDREVIVSRGELIEIGGEFRIPDVMTNSGARLVEVGTTNRTHLGDYEHAINDGTGAILKVHPSNYRIVGFTSAVEARDLARLARGRGVPFIHDLGSGFIGAVDEASWARSEPPVDVSLADGADLVTFSGDKLLGGPQAGVIAGRKDLVDRIARHPLVRALRVDKLTLAALEATLTAYLEGRVREIPLWRMALVPNEELEERARGLVTRVTQLIADHPAKLESVPSSAVTGGGSLPGTEIGSWAVSVAHPERTASELAAALRYARPPVVARVEADRLLLDLRTVFPEQDGVVAHVLARVLTG